MMVAFLRHIRGFSMPKSKTKDNKIDHGIHFKSRIKLWENVGFTQPRQVAWVLLNDNLLSFASYV